jgi:prevent-host-death family protein
MVMKQVIVESTPQARRLGVAEAKSRLSEVLRDAAAGPTIIHSRGRDLAVVLAMGDYEELVAARREAPSSGAAFLERVEVLKQRHGGGVEDFNPPRLAVKPLDPFARKRRTRS